LPGKRVRKNDFPGTQSLKQGDRDGLVPVQLIRKVFAIWSDIAIWRIRVMAKREKELDRIGSEHDLTSAIVGDNVGEPLRAAAVTEKQNERQREISRRCTPI